MKPTWLIQTNMEGVDTGSIISEVLRQGMQVIEIEYHLENNIELNSKIMGQLVGDRVPGNYYKNDD